MTAVKDIICYGSKPLSTFDDDLFEAMVENVIIRSQTELSYILKADSITLSAKGHNIQK